MAGTNGSRPGRLNESKVWLNEVRPMVSRVSRVRSADTSTGSVAVSQWPTSSSATWFIVAW